MCVCVCVSLSMGGGVCSCRKHSDIIARLCNFENQVFSKPF